MSTDILTFWSIHIFHNFLWLW